MILIWHIESFGCGSQEIGQRRKLIIKMVMLGIIVGIILEPSHISKTKRILKREKIIQVE